MEVYFLLDNHFVTCYTYNKYKLYMSVAIKGRKSQQNCNEREMPMWKKMRFKRGVISLLLVIGLVITNFSSFGSWADNTEKNYLETVTNILTPVFGNESGDIAATLIKVTMEAKREDLVTILTDALAVKEEPKAKEEQKTEEKANTEETTKVKEESKTEDAGNKATDKAEEISAGGAETQVEATKTSEAEENNKTALSIPEPPKAQAAPSTPKAQKLGEESLKKLLAIIKSNADMSEVTAVFNKLKADDVDVDKLIEENAKSVENKETKDLTWDKSKYLEKKTIKQGDKSYEETKESEQNIELDINKDFSLVMTVKLPVNDDDKGREYLKKGRKIRIPLATGVKILLKDNKPVYEDTLAATYKATDGSEKNIPNAFKARTEIVGDTVYMDITLLEDNIKFDNILDVNAVITMNFKIDKGNIQQENGKKYITVVEKKIYLDGKVNSQFQMKKTGKVDFNKGNIDWEVWIKKEGDPGEVQKLDGYRFEDAIETLGDYVDNSFKLYKVENGTETPLDITMANFNKDDKSVVKADDKAISCIFPKDTPGEVIVKFSTSLKKDEYKDLKTGFKKYNTAYLYEKDTSGKYARRLSYALTSVAWSGRWGVKYAGGYTTKNEVIANLLSNELSKQNSKIRMNNFVEGDSSGLDSNDTYKVQWNIVFDATGKNLENVTFSDTFPVIGKESKKALGYDSVLLRTWDNEKSIWKDEDITEAFKNGNCSYRFDKLNTLVKIRILSSIKKSEIPYKDRFTNYAYFSWGDKTIELPHDIDLGEKIIVKDAVTTNGYTEANPTWNIRVKKEFVDKSDRDLYVYDAVIYGSEMYWSLLSNPDKSGDGKTDYNELRKKFKVNGSLASKIDLDQVVFNASSTKMVYEEGSHQGLAPKVYELSYDGKPVGHLLEFKLSEGCTSVEKYEQKDYYKFSFRTHVVDADRITGGNRRQDQASNVKNQISNLAWLVAGEKADTSESAKRLTFADSWPNYNYRMIQKDALTSEAATKLIGGDYSATNANSVIKQNERDGAYVQDKKSIVYRLSVNAAGLKTFIDNKNYMNAVIKDMMNDYRFKLVDFNNDYEYLVYEGEAATPFPTTANKDAKLPITDAYVNATSLIKEKDKAKEVVEIPTETKNKYYKDVGNESTFKFNKIEKSYVILYRVELLNDFAKTNIAGTVHNTATFLAWNKTDASDADKYEMKSKKIVSYDAKYLKKDYKINNGIVTWTIDYKPSLFDKGLKAAIDGTNVESVKLYDELDKGLNLFVNNNKPSLNGTSYQLYKLSNNGTLTPYSDKLTNWLSYEKKGDKETLTLTIPKDERDSDFRFTYATVLAGDAAGSINNTVKVMVGEKVKSQAETKAYSVDTGVKISAIQSGNIFNLVLKKVDESGNPIKDEVKFKLTAPNGVGSEQIVNEKGEITFSKIKATKSGEKYLLRETASKTGYIKDNNTYSFTVTEATAAGNKVLQISDFKIEGEAKNESQLKPGDGSQSLEAVNKREGQTHSFKLLKADFDANSQKLITAKDEFEKNVQEDKRTVKVDTITSTLSGIKFSLVVSDSSIDTPTKVTRETDKDGSITFDNLKTGVYKITEESTRDGYEKLNKVYELVVTTAAVNAEKGNGSKAEAVISNPDEYARVIDGTFVVLNKKKPSPSPSPSPSPDPSPSPSPSPSPNPNPNPPNPTTDIPNYPTNDTPDPNDPNSPDEFVAVDEEGTPQGKYVKSKKPDGTEEYIPVDEDGTPLGVNKAKRNLPKTGGSDAVVYYAGGVLLLLLAAGTVVVRRKKYQ